MDMLQPPTALRWRQSTIEAASRPTLPRHTNAPPSATSVNWLLRNLR